MGEIDWVTIRSRCSLAPVFETLKLQLAGDVDKRNSQVGDNLYTLVVNEGRMSVVFQPEPGATFGQSVVFVLTRSAIEIVDTNGQLKFKATPTINNDGECRLKINGKEMELWQVRKLALEDIFFRG